MEPDGCTSDLDNDKFHVEKQCFDRDRGTQRCRLPMHLMSQLKVNSTDTCLSIDFGSHSVLCSPYVWKGQTGNRFQVNDNVIVRRAVDGTACKTATTLTASSFQPLHIERLDRVKIDLVLENSRALQDFESNRVHLIPLIRDAMTEFTILPGCTIDCQHLELLKLLDVSLISVQDCSVKPLSAGKLTTKSTIEIGTVMSRARYEMLSASKARGITVGGLGEPQQLLREIVSYPFQQPETFHDLGMDCPKGILLIGPPGTGKTSLVRAVARDCSASLVYVAGPSICRPQPGESEAALRGVFQEALDLSKEGPCILFLDEVDSFLSRRDEQAGAHSNRVLSQMMTLMDSLQSWRRSMVVIGATNRPNVLDPALRRPGRFDREVYIRCPNKAERIEILKVFTRKLPLQDVDLEVIADWTHNYVGADLALLCQEIAFTKCYIKRELNKIAITEDDFRSTLSQIRSSMQRSSFSVNDCPPISWDDIGGLDEVKRQLKQSLEWPLLHADVFRGFGISWPKGVLLVGPPGCCKTTLARAAATACNASFLSATPAQLYSPYVGESEKSIAEIFHRGRLAAPSIIFFDEIDAIVGKRAGGSKHGIHEKVLSTLLNEMDGIGLQFDSKQGSSIGGQQLRESGDREEGNPKSNMGEKGDVFIVAATNRPDLLDEALMRPGRFDKIICIPPPDVKTRKQILQVLTRKMTVSNLDFDELAEKTCLFSGADLSNLCQQAILCALPKDVPYVVPIRQDHFLSVLETMTPSITNRQLEFYAKWNLKSH